jgi:hypothetical protein
MRTDFQIVIPGRRSEAEANPESSNHRPGLLDSGLSTRGLRPTVSPRNDNTYDSNFKNAVLGITASIEKTAYPSLRAPLGAKQSRVHDTDSWIASRREERRSQ